MVCGLLRFTRNDSTPYIVIARVRRTRGNLVYSCLVIAKAALPTQSLQEPTHTRHCEGLKSPWQSRYGNNHTQSTSVIARTEGSWQSWHSNNYTFITLFIIIHKYIHHNTQPPCDFVASPLTKGGKERVSVQLYKGR